MASGSKSNYNIRLQMGCLVIAGKKYPLYEGLNRIGRSKDATVVIKDENVSQQHAIITIVDDNQHFISDLNSFNGTIVGKGKKLYPLVLFELAQDSVIQFANVIGVYKKVPSDSQSVTDHSYNDRSIKKVPSTQSMNESFYSAQTQALDTGPVLEPSTGIAADSEVPFNYFEDEFSFPDVPTLPLPQSNGLDKNEPLASTSKDDVSIHEAPTQIFCLDAAKDNESQTVSLAIHDLPTQIMCYEVAANECVGGTQIMDTDSCIPIGDLAGGTTEVVDDNKVSASEMDINTAVTQRVTVHDEATQPTVTKESGDLIDGITNTKSGVGGVPNMIHDLPTQINNEVDINIAVTQRDTIHDKPTQPTITKSNGDLIDGETNTKTGDVPDTIHDLPTQINSEVDINSAVTQRDTIHYKLTQLPATKDTLHNDDLNENSNKDYRKSLANLSVDVIDTSLSISVGSRSIIPHDNERASTSKSVQEDKTSQDSDSQSQLCVNQLYRRTLKPIMDDSQEDEAAASGSEVVKSYKVNRKPLQESSPNDSESEEIIPKSKLTRKSRVILDKSDSETDMDEDLGDVDRTCTKGKSVCETEDKKELSGSDTDVEDFAGAKVALNVEHKKASVAMSKIFTSTVIEEATGAKQVDEVNSDSDSNDFEFDLRKKGNESAGKLDDSDIIPSTQPAKDDFNFALHGDGSKHNMEETEGTTQKSKELLKLTQCSEDSFRLGISEFLAASKENDDWSKNSVTSTTNQDEDEDKTPDISDVDEPEDAQLNQEVGDEKGTLKAGPNSTNSNLLVNSNDKDKGDNADDTQDIFEMATQALQNESIQGKSDEMFLKPTFNKSLSSAKKKSLNQNAASQNDDDIFMQATQKIGTDYLFSTDYPSSSTEDDDIFMQPTQKCTINSQDDNEDIFMQSTQVMVLPESGQNKTQTLKNQVVEDIFMQATQPITSPVRTRNEKSNKEDDIFNQSTQPVAVSTSIGQEVAAAKDQLTEDIFMQSTQPVTRDQTKGSGKIDDAVQNQPSQSLKRKLQARQPQSVESQLEVMFASQTLRMSSPSKSRPVNPLFSVLNEAEIDDSDSDGSVKSTASLKEYVARSTLPIDELENLQVGRCDSTIVDLGGKCKSKSFTVVASGGVVDTPRKRGRPLKRAASEVAPTIKNAVDNQEPSTSRQLGDENQTRLTKTQSDVIPPSGKDDDQEGSGTKQVKSMGLCGSLKSTRSSTRLCMDLKDNVQGDKSAKRKTQNSDETAQTKGLLKKQTKSVRNATSTVTSTSRTNTIAEEETTIIIKIENINTSLKVEDKKKQMSESSCNLNDSKSTRSSNRVKTIKEESIKTENINTNLRTDDKKQTNKLSHSLNSKPARTRTRINISNETDGVNESTSNSSSKATRTSKKSTEVDEENAANSKTGKTDTHLQTDFKSDNVTLTRSSRRTVAADQVNVETPTKQDVVNTRKRKSDSNIDENKEKMNKSTEDKDMAEEEITAKTSKLNKGKVIKLIATTKQPTLPGVSSTRSARKKNSNAESLATVITVSSDSSDEASVTVKTVKAKTTKSNKGKSAKVTAVKEESTATAVTSSTSPVLPVSRRGKRILSCDSTTTKPQANATKKMKGSSAHDETKSGSDFGESSFQSPNRNKSATLLGTPDRSRRVTKPKVVFTMFESPALQSVIRHLGGAVVDSIDTATVLVTGSLKRSLKLLTAVGQGKPICSQQWLEQCKKANKFLDPWDFLLKDDEAERKWKFSLSESLNRSQNRKLLEGFTVLSLVNNAADVVKGAVESCGGKCVLKLPAKSVNTNLVVVANPENKAKYSKFLKQKPPVTVVAPEAIFDGVLRQELHWDDHRLS